MPILDWLDEQVTNPGKVVSSIVLIAVLVLVRWLALRAVHARTEHGEIFFRARKWVAYAVTLVGGVGLIQIWLGGVGGLGTYLGILSAGIAIALADVLESLAGWAFILLRRPFKVGDRVEINGIVGDVVDVKVFRFALLEIGNWVGADQSTGRIVHVPNGLVFSEPLSNYTEGFPYIWDEIGVLVTFESQWRRAEELVYEAVRRNVEEATDEVVARSIRRAAHTYLIRYTQLDPITYVSVEDSGVLITGRYLVEVRSRRGHRDRIWRDILGALAEEANVELAYPTVRTYLPDHIRVRSDASGVDRAGSGGGSNGY